MKTRGTRTRLRSSVRAASGARGRCRERGKDALRPVTSQHVAWKLNRGAQAASGGRYGLRQTSTPRVGAQAARPARRHGAVDLRFNRARCARLERLPRVALLCANSPDASAGTGGSPARSPIDGPPAKTARLPCVSARSDSETGKDARLALPRRSCLRVPHRRRFDAACCLVGVCVP